MNVLSLFDGMSCGQIALDQLGIPVNNYYASEIDKYAIEISKKNYPNTIYLGDVTKVKGEDLEKIDLLLGGSPCQGFSFAGKQLNFDDPRSALFFEFVRLLKECNPKYFLLENVRMKKEYQDVITEHLGVEPIMINSALVSAQNRVRLYWTNISCETNIEDKSILLKDILDDSVVDSFPAHRVEKFEETMKENPQPSKNGIVQLNNPSFSQQRVYGVDGKSPTIAAGNLGGGKEPCKIRLKKPNIPQPEDRGIVLKDILENGMATDEMTTSDKKSFCLTARYQGAVAWNSIEKRQRTMVQVGIANDIKGFDCIKRIYSPEGKSPTLTTMQGGNTQPKVSCGAFCGRYEEDGSTKQQLEIRKDDKTNTLTSVQKDNVIVYDNEQPHKESTKEKRDNSTEQILATQMGNSLRFDNVVNEHKAMTLRASNPNGIINKEQYYYRKLTPLECERLQTVPNNYTEGVSNTQRYKMLGNGWTVEVIKHIFKNMEV